MRSVNDWRARDQRRRVSGRADRPRPRIQRAFFQWLDEHRDDLLIQPVIERRTDRRIELHFRGVTPAIWLEITRSEATVGISHEGHVWDLLWSDAAVPRPSGDGRWLCGLCRDEGRSLRVFQTREQLWREHLFNALGDWINDTLASSDRIALYAVEGATWARLLKPGENPGDVVAVLSMRA